MMVTLRLYRQHDLDLITLYRHPSFSLPAAIKKSLFAYVNKEQYAIKQPDPYELPKEKISKIVQIHINLNEKNDKEIISWIKDIKEGYRNSVLKNIIRGYLCGPYVFAYQKSESAKDNAQVNSELFNDNIKNITELKSNKSDKPRQKSKNVDNRRVEDSLIAKQILSNDNTQKKTDNIFIERLENEVKVEIPTEIKEETKPINQDDQGDQDDQNDMWGDIDSMINSF